VLLIAGLFLLAPTEDNRGISAAGYGWALVCGLAIAGFQLLYKAAVADGGQPPLVFLFSMATSLPIVALSLGRGRGNAIRGAFTGHPWLVAFGSASMTVSFLIALYVMRTHGAAWVMTLRNCSVGFAQIFGWTVLRERPTLRAAAGVGFVLADTLLLAFA
jgi:drug/metabolite transporter (DMT)-like permease